MASDICHLDHDVTLEAGAFLSLLYRPKLIRVIEDFIQKCIVLFMFSLLIRSIRISKIPCDYIS